MDWLEEYACKKKRNASPKRLQRCPPKLLNDVLVSSVKARMPLSQQSGLLTGNAMDKLVASNALAYATTARARKARWKRHVFFFFFAV